MSYIIVADNTDLFAWRPNRPAAEPSVDL